MARLVKTRSFRDALKLYQRFHTSHKLADNNTATLTNQHIEDDVKKMLDRLNPGHVQGLENQDSTSASDSQGVQLRDGQPGTRLSVISVDGQSFDSQPNIGDACMLRSSVDDMFVKAKKMGQSFLRRGDLTSARATFDRCRYLLDTSTFQNRVRLSNRIDLEANLASIDLIQGHYTQAWKEFNRIHTTMGSEIFSDMERTRITKWIGITEMFRGRYTNAEKLFIGILNHGQYEDPIKDMVAGSSTRRDLALVSAYLGKLKVANSLLEQCSEELSRLRLKFSKADDTTDTHEAPTTSGAIPTTIQPSISEPRRKEQEILAKEEFLCFAKSRVAYQDGDICGSFETVSKALHSIRKRWGEAHLKTLECASHHALLLALNSRPVEAENAATTTLRAMEREMNTRHPQYLAATGHLITIFCMQLRLVEACDTAKSLATTTQSVFTRLELPNHPQVLQARYLLAKAQFAAGNYASSEEGLQIIVKIAEAQVAGDSENVVAATPYGRESPDTLQFKSLLALVQFHSGKVDGAERLATQVLHQQVKIYHDARLGKILLGKDLLESIGNRHASWKIHFNLLPILRTLGLILQSRGDRSIFTARSLLGRVWDTCKNCLGETSLISLDAEYDLASAFQEQASIDADNSTYSHLWKAEGHLRHVFEERRRIIGHRHPATLCVQRDLIITKLMLNNWKNEPEPRDEFTFGDDRKKSKQPMSCLEKTGNLTWPRVESQLLDLLHLHGCQLGAYHPETLKSYFRVFSVQVLLGDKSKAQDSFDEMTRRLRHSSTQRERLVASLRQELQLALLLSELGPEHNLRALRTLREVVQITQLHLDKKVDDLYPALEMLKAESSRDIEEMTPKEDAARNYHDLFEKVEAKILSHRESRNYVQASEVLTQLWERLGSLYGFSSERPLKEWENIILSIKAALKTPQLQLGAYEEFARILDRINLDYEFILTEEQKKQVREIRSMGQEAREKAGKRKGYNSKGKKKADELETICRDTQEESDEGKKHREQ